MIRVFPLKGEGGDITVIACTNDKGTSVDPGNPGVEYQVKEFARRSNILMRKGTLMLVDN